MAPEWIAKKIIAGAAILRTKAGLMRYVPKFLLVKFWRGRLQEVPHSGMWHDYLIDARGLYGAVSRSRESDASEEIAAT
jgi:hypothetical protein